MPEKKFDFNFDALEIEAHQIVPQENAGDSEPEFRYEPVDIDKGCKADVWSIFGHIEGQDNSHEAVVARSSVGHPAGRKLIADCETAEAAEALSEIIADHIDSTNNRIGGPSYLVPVRVYWFTDKPKGV